MRTRVYFPEGPLRRFRLPRGTPPGARASRAHSVRGWALLPFLAFGVLAYGFGSGRSPSSVVSWLDGDEPAVEESIPQRSLHESGTAARSAPPGSEARASGERHGSAPSPAPGAPPGEPGDDERRARHAAPPEPASAGPRSVPGASGRQRRRPALLLDRHRLRPVTEWKQAEDQSAQPRGATSR